MSVLKLYQTLFVDEQWKYILLAIDSFRNATVESGGSELLDREVTDNDIAFMKSVTLEDIEFILPETESDSDQFKMKNKNTGEYMMFSDRTSSRNEVRGQFLRDKLNGLKKRSRLGLGPTIWYKNISLYDAISEIIRPTKFSESNAFAYLKPVFYEYASYHDLIGEIGDILTVHYQPGTADEMLADVAKASFRRLLNIRQPDQSELYQQLTVADTFKKSALTNLITRAALPDVNAADGSNIYDRLCDLLRENSDAQFGIVSKLDEGQWVRDATFSVPLSERIAHDSLVIESNNMLLRCLSRIRAIDYAIAKKYSDGSCDDIRNEIKNQFKAHLDLIQEKLQSGRLTFNDLSATERVIDSVLIEKLHKANLTKECYSAKDAEKLLFHYRNLSSLLIPARTMVTLTHDKTTNVFQRETQYPVTKKSDAQKEALSVLRQLHPFARHEDKNHHTVNPLAAQEANRLFADLMEEDTRSLPAQARKTHLVGARNAFIVKNELFFGVGPETLEVAKSSDQPDETLWLARTGTPVYVGKGEHSESIQTHTLENLAQIRNTAREVMGVTEDKPVRMHLSVLNTDTPLENQHTMIDHLTKATEQHSQLYDLSYMPTNTEGTFRLLEVSPRLVYEKRQRPRGVAPLNKSKRLNTVADVVLTASRMENTVSLVTCASGQDRTGTAVEKTTQFWMQQKYQDRKCNDSNIQNMRAEGGNAAEITSHLVYGSPGMKDDSQAGDTFNKMATAQFYRTSANTNKKNPVGSLASLNKPSNKAIEEYKQNLLNFEDAIRAYDSIENDTVEKEFSNQAQALLTKIKKIVGEPVSKKRVSAKELDLISLSLLYCQQALEHPEDSKNLQKITDISGKLSNCSSKAMKGLGIGLMAFAFSALVVVGILAAIPTGGGSLLLTLIGASGLSFMAAAGIGTTAIAAAGISGASVYKANSKNELARSLSFFESALSKAKEEEQDVDDENSEENSTDLILTR